MKKLLQGIIEFRKTKVPVYRDHFARLALGQSPKFLFFACADSRVITTMIASSEPGDIFLVRNVGNLVPKFSPNQDPAGEVSEGAAIEFALSRFELSDIIVCGHSECGAMLALTEREKYKESPLFSLRKWLAYGESALQYLESHPEFCSDMPMHNRLSRANVILQLENLRTYPLIRKALDLHQIRLAAWWFDVAKADVYGFDEETSQFILIDESGANHFIKKL